MTDERTISTEDVAERIGQIRKRLADDSLNDAENYNDLVWCLEQLVERTTDGRRCECGYGCPDFQGCRHD